MHKKLLAFVFCLSLPSLALAAEPMSTQPSYDPVPGEFGAGNQNLTVPLPPSFPQYLPNGAINLDAAWIQDGGARLYWNMVVIPRQLKMGGASWVDPALVPLLIPQNTPTAKKRVYRRVARVKTSPAPVNAASRALKSPAIPLPVAPVPRKAAIVPSPFSPTQSRPAPLTGDNESPIPPPRLQ